MDQAPKMEEYFDLSRYGSTETGEDPDDETDYYYTRERYWYHPNYLEGRGKEIYPVNKFPEEPACRDGDMITNDNGHIHQYFVYSPFGENMYQYNRNSDFNSRYRFNGKEIDPETGNQYYGARYYDPKISVWLSVDRMAAKYPHSSPFVFSANNPVMLLDPNGDSVKTGLEGYNILQEGLTATLGEDNPFGYDNKTRDLTINEEFDRGKYGKKQLDVIDNIAGAIKAEKNIEVSIVNSSDPINEIGGESLADLGYNGATTKDGTRVWIARDPIEIAQVLNPEYYSGSGLPKYIFSSVNAPLYLRGVAALHEVGGHANLRLNNVTMSNSVHLSAVESFETSFRQIYRIGSHSRWSAFWTFGKSKKGDPKFLGGTALKH